MELLKENFEALRKRLPQVLYDLLHVSYDVTTDNSKIFENGCFEINLGKTSVYPYGKIDTYSVIDEWVNMFELDESSCNIVTGFGIGLHISAILSKLKANSIVIVGESNLSWLKFVLSKIDCSAILSDERFFLETKPESSIGFNSLNSCELVFKTDAKICFFTPLFVLNESYYYRFITEFCRKFELYQKMQSTVVGDSELWQTNNFKNLKYLVNAENIEVLRNAFAELPLVLVSAGPSLDDAIPFLKEVQHKAIIVSMNTSFRTLAKNGITSHFTLAADPRITTFHGFEGQYTGDTALISTSFVHPNVVKAFYPRIFTWNNPNSLLEYVRKKIGCKFFTELDAQGTVATAVGPLAELLGCKKVCLVGQDLAVKNSGQTHASDSIYRDQNNLFIDTSKCRSVDGNILNKVYVESKLYVYLQFFNTIAKKYPRIQFINTAANGAKIHNIPYKTYEEASEFIGNANSSNVKNLISEKISNENNSKSLAKQTLQPIYDFSTKILNTALEGAINQELAGENFSKNDLALSYQQANKLNALIDNNNEYYSVLLNGKTTLNLFEYRNNAESLTNTLSDKNKINWLSNREYYWAMAEGANFFMSQFENE